LIAQTWITLASHIQLSLLAVEFSVRSCKLLFELKFYYALFGVFKNFPGYIKAHSVPSLAAGLTFGALLAGGAYLNSSEPPRPALQLGTALVLGGLMGYR
jgi:uncharacterized membrane protein (UPF0136 family)